jgi:rhamnogalacturonan acetylesterase
MRSFSLFSATAMAGVASAKVYLAGDSTMAKGGAGSSATQGWGEYLKYSLDLEVVNDAIAGRSARSYTEEGRFDAIADVVASGDFVIIEFGHNDGGTISTTVDNLRTDCYGSGSETCVNGTGAVIQTFPTYITYVT